MKRKFRGRICQEAKSIRTPVAIISPSTTLEEVLDVRDGVEILLIICSASIQYLQVLGMLAVGSPVELGKDSRNLTAYRQCRKGF